MFTLMMMMIMTIDRSGIVQRVQIVNVSLYISFVVNNYVYSDHQIT